MKTNEQILSEVLPNFDNVNMEHFLKHDYVQAAFVMKAMDLVREDANIEIAAKGFKAFDPGHRRSAFFSLALSCLSYVEMVQLAESFIGRIRATEFERIEMEKFRAFKTANDNPLQGEL